MVTIVKNKSGKHKGKVAGGCYRELASGQVQFWHIDKSRYFTMSKALFDMDYTVERVSQ